MTSKIRLPHKDIVAQWKEEKVIKWLKRVHLEDCIPAFEARQIDGLKLLELSEQKLFTYQDLKIKHRKQIAKCVQECKSQASNAKRLAQTIKHKQKSHSNTLDNNEPYYSDDSDDWGTDFEDESEDEEIKNGNKIELNNNTIIQSTNFECSEQISSSSSSQESETQEKFIPKPPDVPVIPQTINGLTGRKVYSGNTNSIPRPPIKRPPSQPPPPPIAQVPSENIQEDYEIPIGTTNQSITERSELSNSSSPSVISSEFATETYELIEPPEETYEMVDAPSSSSNTHDKPVLPPRLPLSSGATSPPPPLPQKPKKLKENFIVQDRLEGVRTFSRPKASKSESETEIISSSPSSVSFFGTLVGRRTSNTSSPKIQHKSNDSSDSALSTHSIVSSNDASSSRSSSPEKDGSNSSLEIKKPVTIPPLPPRGAQPLSEETVQNMATRPLPPVPVPKVEKTVCKEDLSTYPWYHEIERQDAEEIVKSLNESGSFVVRPSKRAGADNPFSVTILHDDKLFHLNIRHRPDDTFALGKEKKKEKTFLSIADLIAFHQTEPILLTSRGEPAGKTILCKYPEKT